MILEDLDFHLQIDYDDVDHVETDAVVLQLKEIIEKHWSDVKHRRLFEEQLVAEWNRDKYLREDHEDHMEAYLESRLPSKSSILVTDPLGRIYSKEPFDDYTHRARVRIEVAEIKDHMVVKHEFNMDIYTDNGNRETVQSFLLERSADNVTKLEIDWWATREQDEGAARLVNEFLK